MSFSFNFNVDPDEDIDAELLNSASSLRLETPPPSEASTSAIPHSEISLTELLATLPPIISYTPVSIPLSSTNPGRSRHVTLLRRDLFDARFQVLSQDSDSDSEEDAAPSPGQRKGKTTVMVDESSDLVKGVYEGGLKTWECSLDLVDYLDGLGFGENAEGERVRGKSVLELGCGTALPSCFLFTRIISEIQKSPTDVVPRKPTRLHLQDYNKQGWAVLSHITLPNLLLAYIRHLASESSSDLPPGDVEVTAEFLDAFERFLKSEEIELRFFVGDWSGMVVPVEARYDLVLTSETIYSIPSLPSLLSLLKAACFPFDAASKSQKTECLVACKRIYFGVGGGEHEFRRRVEEKQGSVETVWGDGEGEGKNRGVGRVVMSVRW